MAESPDADRFLSALHDLFDQAPAGTASPTWVAGAVVETADVVCLYRELSNAPIYGRRIALADFSTLFDPPQTDQELASIFYNNEIMDPSGPGQELDVDWADATGVHRSEIKWVGVHVPEPDTSRQ